MRGDGGRDRRVHGERGRVRGRLPEIVGEDRAVLPAAVREGRGECVCGGGRAGDGLPRDAVVDADLPLRRRNGIAARVRVERCGQSRCHRLIRRLRPDARCGGGCAADQEPAQASAVERDGPGIQPGEIAADQQAPVRLLGQRPDVVVGTGYQCVQPAVGIDAGDALANRGARSAAAERSEASRRDDLAIRLEQQPRDVVVGAWIEARVERTIGVETRDVVSCRAPDRREPSGDEDLPVRLHDDVLDLMVCVGIEGGVERSVRIQPGDEAPPLSGYI